MERFGSLTDGNSSVQSVSKGRYRIVGRLQLRALRWLVVFVTRLRCKCCPMRLVIEAGFTRHREGRFFTREKQFMMLGEG